MGTIAADRELDARGLMCPMPVVKAGKEMKGLQAGQVLRILATDRGAIADIPAWAEDSGNEFLGFEEREGALVFLVRKGDGS